MQRFSGDPQPGESSSSPLQRRTPVRASPKQQTSPQGGPPPMLSSTPPSQASPMQAKGSPQQAQSEVGSQGPSLHQQSPMRSGPALPGQERVMPQQSPMLMSPSGMPGRSPRGDVASARSPAANGRSPRADATPGSTDRRGPSPILNRLRQLEKDMAAPSAHAEPSSDAPEVTLSFTKNAMANTAKRSTNFNERMAKMRASFGIEAHKQGDATRDVSPPQSHPSLPGNL